MGAPDSPLCPLPVRQGQHAVDGPAVFFVGFQVLDDHGHFGVHGFGAGDVVRNVQSAQADGNLLQQAGHALVQLGVLQVAAAHLRAEQIEHLVDELAVVKVRARAVDPVGNVDVDGEGVAVHGVHQVEVLLRGIGDHPLHGFHAVGRARRADGVEDVSDGSDRGLEGLGGVVGAVEAVPAAAGERPRDVDAAARAQLLCQAQLAFAFLQRGLALGGVFGHGVAPRADLRDEQIVLFARIGIGGDHGIGRGVIHREHHGGKPQRALLRRPLLRRFMRGHVGDAESHG